MSELLDFDFDQYKVGETVLWRWGDGDVSERPVNLDDDEDVWKQGTIVRIDYLDRQLPYGVSPYVANTKKRDWAEDVEWNWMRNNQITALNIVIEEEPEPDDLVVGRAGV